MSNILDLGSGKNPVENAFTVDFDGKAKPDLVFDLRDAKEKLRFALPSQEWDEIHCKNVINYFSSFASLQDFFYEVNFLLKQGGKFFLEFMNIANSEGLHLHPLIVKGMLWDARFSNKVLTQRHWLVPTGNVKVVGWKKVKKRG